jgi:hypothetical protein
VSRKPILDGVIANKKWRGKSLRKCRSDESHPVAVFANILCQFEVTERTAGEAIRLAAAVPLNRPIEGMPYGI